MTGFSPDTPRLLRGGLVLLDPVTGVLIRTVGLQYNPDTLTRTLQVQGAGPQAGDRLEALRLKGPPVETIKVDAEIDATDALEQPDDNPVTAQLGLHPQLAALETIVYPPSDRILANHLLAQLGTLEIAPAEAPLTVFVFSATRIVPVRITEFSITEEAFDVLLNPIRAKVSLGMHVLSVNDLPFDHRGTGLFIAHQQRKEQLAGQTPSAALASLGLTGAP
jgi:hypothetical protein